MAESFTDYEKLAFRHAPDATLILADRVILRASLRRSGLVVGGSYGGYVAMAGVTLEQHPRLPRPG